MASRPVRRAEHLPFDARFAATVGCLDDVFAAGGEVRAAYPIGGVTQAVLVGRDIGRSAEHLGRILAVDRHLEVGGGRRAGKLDFEVEASAGENLRFVEGIDRLAGGGGAKGAQH